MTILKEYKYHPLSSIFPLMEGEKFDALVEDIKEFGQIEPVTLYKERHSTVEIDTELVKY